MDAKEDKTCCLDWLTRQKWYYSAQIHPEGHIRGPWYTTSIRVIPTSQWLREYGHNTIVQEAPDCLLWMGCVWAYLGRDNLWLTLRHCHVQDGQAHLVIWCVIKVKTLAFRALAVMMGTLLKSITVDTPNKPFFFYEWGCKSAWRPWRRAAASRRDTSQWRLRWRSHRALLALSTLEQCSTS